MFTGIVEAAGRVALVEPRGENVRLAVETAPLSIADSTPGDSIAVNGVCLTMVAHGPDRFAADVSRETLECTTLGDLRAGSRVNLERALTLASRLGGHLVSGHVDGLGTVVARTSDGGSERFTFELPAALTPYVARKGSICLDGVSLTINDVTDCRFQVQIIPHTLTHTIIGEYQPGTRVNVEVDLVARYVERLLRADARAHTHAVVDQGLLERVGFLAGR